MKKGKINLSRLLFSGLAAFLLLSWCARFSFKIFWNFNVFSARHWQLIWNKWNSGWIVTKPGEIAFLLTVILLPALFLIAWIICYRIRWKNIVLFPFALLEKRKKKALLKKSLAAAAGPTPDLKLPVAAKPAVKKSLPKELNRLRGTPQVSAVSKDRSVPSSGGGQQLSSNSSEIRQENEAVSRAKLWDQLAEKLEQAGIFIFREMKIKNCQTNILAVSQESLYLLCEGPAEGNVWTVDEKSDRPRWTTEKNVVLPSPLRPLISGRDEIKRYIAENIPAYAALDVNCCLFLDHGTIANVPDMLSFLEEVDLSVLRLGSCKSTELPDTNALIEYIKSQTKSDQALNDAVAVAILDLMEADHG